MRPSHYRVYLGPDFIWRVYWRDHFGYELYLFSFRTAVELIAWANF